METKNKPKVSIWTLVLFILKVSFIGFGGGNALMPVIYKEAVVNKKWFSDDEFDDIVIVTNMLPGASVIQTISYICIHLKGKLLGTVITLLAILPHVLFAFVLLVVLTKFVPKEYLKIISTGVLVSIIAFLIEFGIRYIKLSHKGLKTPLWIIIFTFTFAFCTFVPSPANLPVIAIVSVIGIYSLLYIFINHKYKNKSKPKWFNIKKENSKETK
ncbi:chromate transporter [Mycoplasma nasistruthionis]|uniref:Chromate transporter n=1 Tax=Mycoplasma nasistruthionis TaxID=353852 RepID=A0A4Y6I581_9MOLU|nr:chromate transporter [Mycoplasma nasistruthionis]QDF64754.1 chromate transporter [Mycoplasma nasistruthionis]